jgi:uncharacterized membrane protein YeaQ/YmgE (transglycosylase-associated protein family)
MIVFELISWVGIGSILAGCIAFFMEKQEHVSIGHLFAGVGGAIAGGLVGEFIGYEWSPLRLDVSGYSVFAMLAAIAGAGIFIYVENHRSRRGRPIFPDPRPDLP